MIKRLKLWSITRSLAPERSVATRRRAIASLEKMIGSEMPMDSLASRDGHSVHPYRQNVAKQTPRKNEEGVATKELLELLSRSLTDADDRVRATSARMLGALGEPSSVTELIKALADDQGEVRLHAAIALELLGEPAWVHWVCGDADDFQRMGSSRDPRVIEVLTRALGAPDATVRERAAQALGALGDARAVGFLLDHIRDKAAAVRHGTVTALGKLGDQRAAAPLIRALADDDAELRARATQALSRLGESAVEPLVVATSDGEWKTRMHAAMALGELDDERAVAPLIQLLGDYQEQVRDSAIDALSRLGEAAVQPLVLALGQWGVTDGAAAAKALAHLGDIAVGPLTEALGNQRNRDVRRHAALALRQMEIPEAVTPLIDALFDEDDLVRGAAAKGLGNLGDRRALGPLRRLRSDRDPSVRESVAEALEKLES